MNTDFRVSVSMFKNPKTRRLIRRLGTDGVYHLLLLWGFTAMIRPDGILSGMDSEEIEDAAEWQGEPGAFYQALVDLRLLDVTENGEVAIHDWQEHNGYASYAGERSARAREAANARWGKKTGAVTHDATHDASAYASHMRPAYAPSPSPDPSPIADANASACAEVSQATPAAPEPEALPPALPAPAPEVLLRFPLAGKAGEYPITQADLDEWQEAFPGIDALQALKVCLQWNRDNPKRRKTRSGIRRHISSWLAREQDRNSRAAPALPGNRPSLYPQTARQRYMREVGNLINAIAEAKRDATNHENHDVIDLTPPRKLGPVVRTLEPPGRALPGGWA